MRIVMLLAVAATAAVPALAQKGPFSSVRVTPSQAQFANRKCPVEIVFTGAIALAPSAGRDFYFNYTWERTDGSRGASKFVRPRPGQRVVTVRERWKVGERGRELEAGAILHVTSGNTTVNAASPMVKVHCR